MRSYLTLALLVLLPGCVHEFKTRNGIQVIGVAWLDHESALVPGWLVRPLGRHTYPLPPP